MCYILKIGLFTSFCHNTEWHMPLLKPLVLLVLVARYLIGLQSIYLYVTRFALDLLQKLIINQIILKFL